MRIRESEWHGAPIEECARVLADLPFTIFFDSNRASHPESRFSFLCWNPLQVLKTKNGELLLDNKKLNKKCLFTALKETLNAADILLPASPFPFIGGLAGFTSYDYGCRMLDIPVPTDSPVSEEAIYGLYTNVLAYDHEKNAHYLYSADEGQENYLRSQLKKEQSVRKSFAAPDWQTSRQDTDYLQDIVYVQEQIRAGEVYQINLTRQNTAPLPEGFHAYSHYETLRQINPAPFSVFMNAGEWQMLSCSPERFLECREGMVETKPIKGTLPASEPESTLQNDPKERAENTMIVDLMRNDLSKVCAVHSVKVPQLCAVENFEGLHHLVSTVTGELQENKDVFDLLKATFPGGSITGAPKLAAMQQISNIEKTARGPYCGSAGYIGFDGCMDMNILIRTVLVTADKIVTNAGGGIVSDSIPERELAEAQQKLKKIMESFEQPLERKSA
jgi:para-aminobenzoate synthetase component 1